MTREENAADREAHGRCTEIVLVLSLRGWLYLLACFEVAVRVVVFSFQLAVTEGRETKCPACFTAASASEQVHAPRTVATPVSCDLSLLTWTV